MINFKNEKLVAAFEAKGETRERVAVMSEGSKPVLAKLLNGETDFTVTSAHKFADYLGLDIQIEFVEKSTGDTNVNSN